MPSFLSDNNTPNRNDPEWVILQKILGTLSDISGGGGGGGGPFVDVSGDTMTGALSFSGTTNSGLRLNNLTTVQRNAIAAPAAGMAIWDTTQTRLSVYDGSGWTDGFVRLAGDTMTGDLSVPDVTITANGALSDPSLSVTGTPITGGTATTTKPLVLIETAGATSTGWSTSGTMLGVNAPSGFAGRIADFQLNGTSYFVLSSSGSFSLLSTGSVSWSQDVFLFRDGAANTLALRNSTNAQVFRVYNTYTDASNYERGFVRWNANAYEIGVEVAGTGTSRQMNFYTNGAARWQISASGHFIAPNDNTYDIGASGANRPRHVYVAQDGTFGGNLVSGGFIDTASGGTIRFLSRTRFTSPSDGVLTFLNNASNDFGRINLGGTTSSFPAIKRSSAILQTRLADDSDYAAFEADTVRTAKARTVAQLPAAGSAGRRAYVTDANATTFMSVVAGGGANVVPVFDDGTNWVIA